MKVDIWRIDDAPKAGEFWTKSDVTDMRCVHVPSNPSSKLVGMQIMAVWDYCLDRGWKCTLLETHKDVDPAQWQ